MSKHKLLLADDSITIQKVVNLTFADEGVEVVSVSDGNAALEKLSEFSPDLVMVDINMPGLSGYEICERIKQNEATCQTPVILLVGSFEPFDEEEARRVGANDFLTKPFQSIRQLVTKVTTLLESAESRNTSTDEIISDLENQQQESASQEFVDTLEMEAETAANEEFGDAGFDDEMIQTSQINTENALPVENVDSAITQPLSSADLEEISSFETAPQMPPNDEVSETEETKEVSEERGYAVVGEMPLSPEITKLEELSVSTTSPTEANLSPADFYPQNIETTIPQIALDEGNLLELPPTEISTDAATNQTSWQEEISTASPFSETNTEISETISEESRIEEPQTQETSDEFSPSESLLQPPADSTQEVDETNDEVNEIPETKAENQIAEAVNLPPQVIEAIAEKVSERFSEDVIRGIVAEITPKITELIAKRIAEEK